MSRGGGRQLRRLRCCRADMALGLGTGVHVGRPMAAPRPSAPKANPRQRRRRWHASLCFIVGQLEATPRRPAPQPGHVSRRQNHRGLGARPGPRSPPPGRAPLRAGRASVELDGAAVVLAVLALLLRGAHEAAQKVAWKQVPIRGPGPRPTSHAPTTLPVHKGHVANGQIHGRPGARGKMLTVRTTRDVPGDTTRAAPRSPGSALLAAGRLLTAEHGTTRAGSSLLPRTGRPQTRAPRSRSQRREPPASARDTRM